MDIETEAWGVKYFQYDYIVIMKQTKTVTYNILHFSELAFVPYFLLDKYLSYLMTSNK